MSDNMINWEKDADGVVIPTMDDPNQGANTMNELFQTSIKTTVERLEAEKDDITGVIITSAKKTFFAGGDLGDMTADRPKDATKADIATAITNSANEMKKVLRRLETLASPSSRPSTARRWAVAWRSRCTPTTASRPTSGQQDRPAEVTLGLLPGGGGVVRTVRLLGIQNALMGVLLQGTSFSPEKARRPVWSTRSSAPSRSSSRPPRSGSPLTRSGPAVRRQGYKIPGGAPTSPAPQPTCRPSRRCCAKQIRAPTCRLPRAILAAAIEGCLRRRRHRRRDRDALLRLAGHRSGRAEHDRAFFFDLQHINGGGSRPKGFDKYTPKKVGVIGAGMMGAAIAYVTAKAGIDVVLKDINIDAANKGKDYSVQLGGEGSLARQDHRGEVQALLDRIHPTVDAADFAGVDFVIEAAFESVEVKNKVFREIEDVVDADAVLGSNTSTLPITILAEGVKRSEDFIGIRFFSPVDKMPLVEIIKGAKTSDAVLAKVIDYTLAIRRPRSSSTTAAGSSPAASSVPSSTRPSRPLARGVEPALIEQAGSQAGYRLRCCS